MPAKKGKGKKEAAGKNSAEVARLALLRAQEAEAENFLHSESERRRRDELEERITFLRDEQLRAIRDKDNQLAAIEQRLAVVTAAKAAYEAAHEAEKQQMGHEREVLRNEGSLAKVEMEELQGLLQRERASTAMRLEQLQETLEAERRAIDDNRQHLRSQACEAMAQVEVLRQRLQRMSEEKDFQERSHNLERREMGRDLEQAVATSKALREAVAERDTDGRKNIALLHLLNAQLDSDTRRHETELNAAQERSRRAEGEVERLASRCTAAHEALDNARREAREAKQSAATELHELRQLVEQVKFDAAYLHRELDTLNAERCEAAAKAEATVQALQAELRTCQVEREAAAREGEELKALLLRKEREHFDKITFLNAQVSNGRTTVAQLQGELQHQREASEKALRHHEAEQQKVAEELESHTAAARESKEARRTYDQTVLAEMEALRASVAALRAQLASREEIWDQVRASKDAEVARLRAILDTHFIPNRKDVEVARESARMDEVFHFKDELRQLKEKALQREAAQQETESWLRSRVADQADVIAALQLDLKEARLGSNESVRSLESEVGRLRQTLEVHRISCT